MWPCLLIVSTVLSLVSAKPKAHAPSDKGLAPPRSSIGPRSSQEAQVLWKEGNEAFAGENFKDAAMAFQRFVDRYPSQPESIEARHLLAQSRMKLGQPAQALPYFKAYVGALGKTVDAARGRNELGWNYLELGKFREAHLNTIETLKQTGKIEIPEEIKNQALLLQVEALLGLKREREAEATLLSTEKAFVGAPSDPGLRAQLARVKALTRNRECSKLPSSGRLDEAQVTQQLNRRGTCHLEAFVNLRSLYETEQIPWIERTQREMLGQIRDFTKLCVRPPAPPGSRSAIQLKRYQAELASRLMNDCKKPLQQAQDFLTSWKAQVPASTHSEIDKTLKDLSEIVAELRISS